MDLISSSEKPITPKALITALWLDRSLLEVFKKTKQDHRDVYVGGKQVAKYKLLQFPLLP